MITLPGLIDPHVHFRDPGQTQKEDFYTGTSAALAGGYTTVFDMPNNKVPITTVERLSEKISIASGKIVCDVGFHFGSLGDNLEEFEKVKDLVIGLKLYLNDTTGHFFIERQKLAEIFNAWNVTRKPILFHAEDDAVAAVIELVRQTGQQAHFCHISTADDLRQIIRAKKENLPISCGVTPHHLFLTDEDIKVLGPFGRMKPSLKPKNDQEFLWKNIAYVDCVESDHAPHTKEEKNPSPAPARPPYGVPGLETTLPLLLTAVSQNRLTLEDVIRLCYKGPLKIFHVTPDNATVEVDIDREYEIKGDNLYTKCKWSPFEGLIVRGKIKRVTLRGKTVFENGQILAQPGDGKITY